MSTSTAAPGGPKRGAGDSEPERPVGPSSGPDGADTSTLPEKTLGTDGRLDVRPHDFPRCDRRCPGCEICRVTPGDGWALQVICEDRR